MRLRKITMNGESKTVSENDAMHWRSLRLAAVHLYGAASLGSPTLEMGDQVYLMAVCLFDGFYDAS